MLQSICVSHKIWMTQHLPEGYGLQTSHPSHCQCHLVLMCQAHGCNHKRQAMRVDPQCKPIGALTVWFGDKCQSPGMDMRSQGLREIVELGEWGDMGEMEWNWDKWGCEVIWGCGTIWDGMRDQSMMEVQGEVKLRGKAKLWSEARQGKSTVGEEHMKEIWPRHFAKLKFWGKDSLLYAEITGD